MNPGRRWDRDDRVPIGLRRALGTVAVPNLLVISWRWRYEMGLVAGLSISLTAAITSFGAGPTILAMIVIILASLCWPTARHFATDRAWCIVSPHRVRVGCAEGLIYSSRGKIPIILRTSHREFGERVLLWCRAGTCVEDFVSARAILTAACWAQDVAVFFDTRNTHLVTLDVIRRAPGEIISGAEGRRSYEPLGEPHAWPRWSGYLDGQV
jgi:hypothetical protein